MNGSVNTPRFHTLLHRERKEHVLMEEKKSVFSRPRIWRPGLQFSGLWRGEGRSLGAWKTAQAELRDNRKRRGVERTEWEKDGVEEMSL